MNDLQHKPDQSSGSWHYNDDSFILVAMFSFLLLAMLATAGQAHRLTDFPVAGINLATFGMSSNHPEECSSFFRNETASLVNTEKPFEIFESFDIGHRVRGDENFWEMMRYKRDNIWPSILFYNDKVAFKRWLMSLGIDIPKPFILSYLSELSPSGEINDTKKLLREMLPKNEDYAAKPSHSCLSKGIWLVSHNADTNVTRVSDATDTLTRQDDFEFNMVADSLAESMYATEASDDDDSCYLSVAKHGVVVEERFASYSFHYEPAMEFKAVVIWGRMHMAAWRVGGYKGNWPGFVHRNGTLSQESEVKQLPDWVEWSRVVEIAERMGAHKDYFRVDIFVGVPATGSPVLQQQQPDGGEVEDKDNDSRRATAGGYVVSEVSAVSTEPFSKGILEEAARLWIAGYKIGNYRSIPNKEVPVEFQDNSRM